MEALFCTLIIDSYEERDMAAFDVPGAYPHADIPKDNSILMKLRGGVVEIMCQFNPEYEQHVKYENGLFLYILVLREIYGYFDSALL